MHGWTRESFTAYSAAVRSYTQAEKLSEFSKPNSQQDIYYGFKKLNDRVLENSNAVRYISKEIALDEEIVKILGGKCRGQHHNPDKKGDRGPKNYVVCGRNSNPQDKDTKKTGYYH